MTPTRHTNHSRYLDALREMVFGEHDSDAHDGAHAPSTHSST